jgi:hypothetical protein
VTGRQPGVEDLDSAVEGSEQAEKRAAEVAEADDPDGGACQKFGLLVPLEQPLLLSPQEGRMFAMDVPRQG